jgi:hypothetical protein
MDELLCLSQHYTFTCVVTSLSRNRPHSGMFEIAVYLCKTQAQRALSGHNLELFKGLLSNYLILVIF